MVNKAYEACMDSGRAGFRILHAKLSVEERVTKRSVKRAVMALGFGLGFLAIASEDCWVTESPLFMVLGSIVCLLFLALSWVAGGIWWLVTGSKKVCIWAKGLLPFGVQPYRSASGISILFFVLAIGIAWLLRILNRMPSFERHRRAFFPWLRFVFWLATVFVWFLAIWLNLAGPGKPEQ